MKHTALSLGVLLLGILFILPFATALTTGTVFYDNAETGIAETQYNFSQGGSDRVFNYSTDRAFNGSRSLQVNNTADFHALYTDLNGSLDDLAGYTYSAYFYDDGRNGSSLMGTGAGLQNQGTALFIGVYPPLSGSTYFISVNGTNIVTSVNRAVGWHHARIIFNSSTRLAMAVDTTTVYNDSVDDLSSNGAVLVFEEGFGSGESSYYDDILVFQTGNASIGPPPVDVPPSIRSSSVTISGDNATLTLLANATDPDTPTVSYSWNLIKDGVSLDTGTTGAFPANLTTIILTHGVSVNGTYSFNVSAVGNATVLSTNSISATFGPPIDPNAGRDENALQRIISLVPLLVVILSLLFSLELFGMHLVEDERIKRFIRFGIYSAAGMISLVIILIFFSVL